MSCKRFLPLSMRGKGPEGFIPLYTSIADNDQAKAIRDTMMDLNEFNTYLPFPTAAKSNYAYSPTTYWRGRVWLDQAYYGMKGLKNYGYLEDAQQLLIKTIKNAEGMYEAGGPLRENYNPETGTGLGATNFSWSAAMLYLAIREIIMDDDIDPVNTTQPQIKSTAAYSTDSDVSDAINIGYYDDIIDRRFTPTALSDWNPRDKEGQPVDGTMLNPMMDQGAWHGFGLPDSIDFDENPTPDLGFSGPMVVMQEYSKTISDQLLKVKAYADDTMTDEYVVTKSVSGCTTGYKAQPGALIATYAMKSSTTSKSVCLRQIMRGIALTSIDDIQGRLHSPTTRTTAMETSYSCPDNDDCPGKLAVKLYGATWTNEIIQRERTDGDDNYVLWDQDQDVKAWSRDVTWNNDKSMVTYTFGKMHVPYDYIISPDTKLTIKHTKAATQTNVGCYSDSSGLFGSSATKQTDHTLCGSKGSASVTNYQEGVVTLTGPTDSFYTVVAWEPDVKNNATLAVDLKALNSNDVKTLMAKTEALWVQMIKNAVRRVDTLPSQLVWKDLDRLIVKTIETLVGNWRSPAKDMGGHAGGIVPATTGKWFNGIWAWDSWKEAAAISSYNITLARIGFEGMFFNQLEDGMIIDSAFFNNPGENTNARNTKPPLATWCAAFITNHIDDDSTRNQWIATWGPPLKRYHDWWFSNRDHDLDGIPEYGGTVDPSQTVDAASDPFASDKTTQMTFNATLNGEFQTSIPDDMKLRFLSGCQRSDGYVGKTSETSYDCVGGELYRDLTIRADIAHSKMSAAIKDATAWESGRDNASNFGYIDEDQLRAYAKAEKGGDMRAAQLDWTPYWLPNLRWDDNVQSNIANGFSIDQVSVDLTTYIIMEKKLLLDMNDKKKFMIAGAVSDLHSSQEMLKNHADKCYWDDNTKWFYDARIRWQDNKPQTSTTSTTKAPDAPTVIVNEGDESHTVLLVVGILVIVILIAMLVVMSMLYRSYNNKKVVVVEESKNSEDYTLAEKEAY